MKQPDYYKKSITLLLQLKKDYPTTTVARHLDIVLSPYSSFWSLSDKEFYKLLEDYKAQLDSDINPHQNLNDIIDQATDLSSLLYDEDDDLY